MSLQDELDAFKASWVERVGPEAARMMAEENAALLPMARKARTVGDDFPPLTLTDQLGRAVDLSVLMAGQPLVVVFYRGGWCPYCNLELRAYQQALAQIEALGARVIAVSPESPDDSLSTAEKNALAFTVLSDNGGGLSDALGIRYEFSDALKEYFVRAGRDFPTHHGDGRWSLPIPATYVVGKGGRIAFAEVDPDYRVRVDPADVLAVLRSVTGNPD